MTPAECQHEPLLHLSDEELACRAQAGSSGSFAEVIRRHGPGLLAFLTRRTGNRHDAEDLLQETFVRAFRSIGRYQPRWKLKTWLFTIAARLACTHFRRSAARPALARGATEAVEHRPDPAEQAAAREQAENLWALARRALPQAHWTALWLRYAEQMPVKEIARAMGKTPTHVKVMLFRARSRLATEMDGPGGSAATHRRAARSTTSPRAGEEGEACSAHCTGI